MLSKANCLLVKPNTPLSSNNYSTTRKLIPVSHYRLLPIPKNERRLPGPSRRWTNSQLGKQETIWPQTETETKGCRSRPWITSFSPKDFHRTVEVADVAVPAVARFDSIIPSAHLLTSLDNGVPLTEVITPTQVEVRRLPQPVLLKVSGTYLKRSTMFTPQQRPYRQLRKSNRCSMGSWPTSPISSLVLSKGPLESRSPANHRPRPRLQLLRHRSQSVLQRHRTICLEATSQSSIPLRTLRLSLHRSTVPPSLLLPVASSVKVVSDTSTSAVTVVFMVSEVSDTSAR